MEITFGEFLKQKRTEKQLTQKNLAKILFVSESAVSKWEKNIAHPDITLLPKLSEVLGVTEHELITASIDKQSRTDKIQAKKWRALSFSWSLFFYIAYLATLIPCFICDLAINRGLTWFWIVLSALILGFTFTNLPQLIKKHKLILLPLSMFLSLCLLLGACCIYTQGNWFLIPVTSVFFGLVLVFTPIYISKYKVFSKIKNYNDLVSIGIDFVILNLLLLIIYSFTISNGYANTNWYLTIALPIVTIVYLFLNILVSIRFLRISRLIKTSIILFLISISYFFIPLIKIDNIDIQKELSQINIFQSDFSNWTTEFPLENNVHCIIFLTLITLSIIFFIAGLIKYFKTKTQTND